MQTATRNRPNRTNRQSNAQTITMKMVDATHDGAETPPIRVTMDATVRDFLEAGLDELGIDPLDQSAGIDAANFTELNSGTALNELDITVEEAGLEDGDVVQYQPKFTKA